MNHSLIPKRGDVVVNIQRSTVFVWRSGNDMHHNQRDIRKATEEEKEWLYEWDNGDPNHAMAILPFIHPLENLGRDILRGLVNHPNANEAIGEILLDSVKRTIEPKIYSREVSIRNGEWLQITLNEGCYAIDITLYSFGLKFGFYARIKEDHCRIIADSYDMSFVDLTQVGFEKMRWESPFEASPTLALKCYRAIKSRIELSKWFESEIISITHKIAFWQVQEEKKYVD